MDVLKQRIQLIHREIAATAKANKRNSDDIRLLAVSKQQSWQTIRTAYQCGLRAFAENYCQEAMEKIQKLQDLRIEWHFIGPVQSNKTSDIANSFSWLHSLSRTKIALRLNKQRPTHLPPLNVLLQVNISADDNRSGIQVQAIDEFAHFIKALPQLHLRGLMTITAKKNPELIAADYAKMFTAFQKLKDNVASVDTLSMGMSADFPLAVQHGATLLRIGTKLFGKRS